MALTALDMLVLLLVGGGALFGVLRGFVTEILSLLAWVAAIAALKIGYGPVSAWLAGPVGTAAGASVLAFVMIFAITFFGGKLIAASMGRRTRASVLGPVDRILGLGFGALKGLIGATVLFLGANLGYDTIYGAAGDRPEWMRASRTFPLLHATGGAIVDFVAARRGAAAAEPDRDDADRDDPAKAR